MVESLYTALTAGGTSALSSLLTCFIMRQMFKRDEEHRQRTETSLREAKERRLADQEGCLARLTQDLSDHISEDQSQRVLTKLEAMELGAREREKRTGGMFETLTAKVDRALQKNEGLEHDIKNQAGFLKNLREDLQNHINSTHGGMNYGRR